VSAQLLVLLLPLVVEDKDLCAAPFFHQLADYARFRLRFADLPVSRRNRQYLLELDMSVGASSQFLHSNHIPGRHPVLLAAGADNRVHTSASVKFRERQLTKRTLRAHLRNFVIR